jgi:hypothetical protein
VIRSTWGNNTRSLASHGISGDRIDIRASPSSNIVRFALDWLVEGDGSELPVPRLRIDEIHGEPGPFSFTDDGSSGLPSAVASSLYAGGGTKPPISAASRRANSIVVGSSLSGLLYIGGAVGPAANGTDRP